MAHKPTKSERKVYKYITKNYDVTHELPYKTIAKKTRTTNKTVRNVHERELVRRANKTNGRKSWEDILQPGEIRKYY